MTQGARKEQIIADLSKNLMEPRITVVGCGGAGNNITNGLYWNNKSINTVAINTDEAKLEEIEVHTKILIGNDITYGKGTNGSPEVGEYCAQLARETISKVLEGSDIVFVVAGMGGGTGTGTAPVVANIAQDLDAITFVIAINPFSHEGGRREIAQEGLTKLKEKISNLIILENDRLLSLAGDCTLDEGFGIIERSINNLISSMSNRIVEVLREQIRLEVSEALMDIEDVVIVKPASITVPEIIRAESMEAELEVPYAHNIASQFLTR